MFITNQYIQFNLGDGLTNKCAQFWALKRIIRTEIQVTVHKNESLNQTQNIQVYQANIKSTFMNLCTL